MLEGARSTQNNNKQKTKKKKKTEQNNPERARGWVGWREEWGKGFLEEKKKEQ